MAVQSGDEAAHRVDAGLDGLSLFHSFGVDPLDGFQLHLFGSEKLGGDLSSGDGFSRENGQFVALHLRVAADDDELLDSCGGIEAEDTGAELGKERGAVVEDSDEAVIGGDLVLVTVVSRTMASGVMRLALKGAGIRFSPMSLQGGV